MLGLWTKLRAVLDSSCADRKKRGCTLGAAALARKPDRVVPRLRACCNAQRVKLPPAEP